MVLVRVRPSLYIPSLMLLWGTCATCLGAIQTKGQLWAVRFLLGITEAGFAVRSFPGKVSLKMVLSLTFQ